MEYLLIKLPKSNEYTYEKSMAVFSALHEDLKESVFRKFKNISKASRYYSFNIISVKQMIEFVIVVDPSLVSSVKNQILSQYSDAEIVQRAPFNFKTRFFGDFSFSADSYYPIQTIDKFGDADPLASILSSISRSTDPKAIFWVQVIISSQRSKSIQSKAASKIDALSRVPEGGVQLEQNKMAIKSVTEKLNYKSFKVNLRILSNSEENLETLKSAFSVFNRIDGNNLVFNSPSLLKKENLLKASNEHKPYGRSISLNTLELATIYHFPNSMMHMPNIVWGKRLNLDTPENLPVNLRILDNDKQRVNFFGKTKYKNQDTVFGIKDEDRLRHMYIIGKTGTGKSTMIENMAIDDIRKGKGVGVLDPHGTTIQHILQFTPKKRVKDVCYFNPADPEYSYPLNILEIDNPNQKELVVSGIISIFHKLYAHSWGPRLEYILRNVLLSLTYVPNATLPDVMKMLLDKKYREKAIKHVKDPFLKQFWLEEFGKMSPSQMQESISPILNKVGQFVTSPLIRKVISYPKSKIKLKDILDGNKIFLCDLSQGKIGEDNATLLGSMIITLIQLNAINRTGTRYEEMNPFYLYVDEFQNFATNSFVKILSEIRKYKLSLTVANQYIDQIDPDVTKAILGNVGTLINFTVGANDAFVLTKEFGIYLKPEDLTAIERHHFVMKMTVDGEMTPPFTGESLPPPKNLSGHIDKIVENTRRKYGIKVKDI